MSGAQLPLHLRWREHPQLAGFVAGRNATALAAVLALARGDDGASAALLLRGAPATGKTHLLLAACHEASRAGADAAYLSFAEMDGEHAVQATEGLQRNALVCVDDVQAAAGERRSEEALFHLYNRCEASGARMLLSASAAVPSLGLELADLASRLAACVSFELREADDRTRAQVLRGWARARGLEMPDEVLDYLLGRHARDLHSLLALFERLDEAALAGKRRLTVPLARAVLERISA